MSNNETKEIQERILKLREEAKAKVKGTDVLAENTSAIIAEDTPKHNSKAIDFSSYEANNWLCVDDNPTLNDLKHKGVAIWINKDGDLSYRFRDDGEITSVTQGKASNVFSALLKIDITLFCKGANIQKHDLRLVREDIFDPQGTKEFTDKGDRNIFNPTKYLIAKGNKKNEPKAIISLIRHLCNNDQSRFEWVINWFACFFQTLDKAHTALVLWGVEGVGKGIFFNDIITPLFGEKFTVTIDNKTLINSKYLGGLIENRLFINLDEIEPDKKNSQEFKNFLKPLITGKALALDQKHKNITKETALFGQVLITSNNPYVVEISPNDRRFTVIKTGDKLINTNWLGYNTDKGLINAIKKELMDFALYLKEYRGDFTKRNIPLDTPEKMALIQNTTDKFTLFVHAIKSKDIGFFDDCGINAVQLLDLKNDFEKNRIQKEGLANLFSKSTESEEISTKRLMKLFRAIEPIMFSDENLLKSDGQRYYKIL